jgi:hypothetical protein
MAKKKSTNSVLRKILKELDERQESKDDLQIDNSVYSKSATRKRKKFALKNIYNFILTYEKNPDIKEISFNDIHKWLNDHIDKPGVWACLGSRKFGKTWFMKWVVLYFIATGKKKYIGIGTNTVDDGEEWLNTLRSVLIDHPTYKLIRHDFKIKVVRNIEGYVKFNKTAIRVVTFQKSGRGKQEVFDRFDFFIVDDLEKLKDYNPLQSDKKKKFVFAECLASMGMGINTVIWLGNNFSITCAIHKYLKEKPEFCQLYPAMNKDQTKTNWSAISTEELLKLKETMPIIEWTTEFMQDPSLGFGRWKEKDLRFLPQSKWPKFKTVIEYHDPAWSILNSACLKASVILGLGLDNTIYILDIYAKFGTYKDFFTDRFPQYTRYGVQAMLIENNLEQWDNIKEHYDLFKFKNQIRIKLVRNHKNKFKDIDKYCAELFEYAGKCYINEAIKNNIYYQLLIEQMSSYDGTNKKIKGSKTNLIDILDAIARGTKHIRLFNSGWQAATGTASNRSKDVA